MTQAEQRLVRAAVAVFKIYGHGDWPAGPNTRTLRALAEKVADQYARAAFKKRMERRKR